MALDVAKYKEQLIKERDELAGDVGRVADVVQAIPSDNDNNVIEVAQHGPVVDVESTILDRKSNRLEQINAALDRIDDGTYGTCTKCGKDIDPRRLEAEPAAHLCIDDALAEDANIATPTL
jgi:RNA polymerase-binding protein DksA